MSLVTLSCPNCGGKLEITSDIERFACAYCGYEHVVNRGGGIVTLKPVIEKIEQVKKSVERGANASEKVAAELALQRIEKEKRILMLELSKTEPESVIGWGIILFSCISMGLALLANWLLSSSNDTLALIAVFIGSCP